MGRSTLSMPNGGTLCINAKKADNAFRIQVIDTGPGISKKNLTQIYVDHNSKGKTFEQFSADMERDNFMSSKTALEYGLVDSILTKRI